MKPIHSLKSSEFDALMAWGRYLFWCDLHRRRFEAWLDEPRDLDTPADRWHSIALTSQWYASLWVVIDGWREAAFDDAIVDRLLAESGNKCDRLRRYRNGIYHYQPRLIEPRLVDFLAEADEIVPWTDILHREFLRFFDEMLSTIPGEENREALRDSVVELIGWLPMETPAARLREVETLSDDAESLVHQSGDALDPEARHLLRGVAEARAMARDAIGRSRYRAWTHDLVDSITTTGRPRRLPESCLPFASASSA